MKGKKELGATPGVFGPAPTCITSLFKLISLLISGHLFSCKALDAFVAYAPGAGSIIPCYSSSTLKNICKVRNICIFVISKNSSYDTKQFLPIKRHVSTFSNLK